MMNHKRNSAPPAQHLARAIHQIFYCRLTPVVGGIAFIHNGYHRAYLQRRRKKNQGKRRFWNYTTRPRHPGCCRSAIGGTNKSPQKLFHWQTILIHHVSHYRMASGSFQNPYLDLFNLRCVFFPPPAYRGPSLAAIDLAKRRRRRGARLHSWL